MVPQKRSHDAAPRTNDDMVDHEPEESEQTKRPRLVTNGDAEPTGKSNGKAGHSKRKQKVGGKKTEETSPKYAPTTGWQTTMSTSVNHYIFVSPRPKELGRNTLILY